MQLLMTFMAVVGGLVFSVAVALMVEEFIFGQVFRIFFTSRPNVPGRSMLGAWAIQPVRIKSQQH